MWLKFVLPIVLVLAGAILVVVFFGASRWQAGTNRLHADLESARLQHGVETYDPSELEGLPLPAQRYFRAVLKEGQPIVAAATVEHTGDFNLGEAVENWAPFTSTQRVITRRPGFVWDARIRMAPGLNVFVHDAYVGGEGVLMAKLAGLLTVMEQPRTPELAHGELMRFLAEAAWYPTALLPSRGVRWEAIDDSRAGIALDDGATTVRLELAFDAQGLIATVRSDGRYRVIDGVPAPTPWQGRFWNYELRDGMLVPLEGEVAWLLPGGPKTYWRGRIRRLEYEYGQ